MTLGNVEISFIVAIISRPDSIFVADMENGMSDKFLVAQRSVFFSRWDYATRWSKPKAVGEIFTSSAVNEHQ